MSQQSKPMNKWIPIGTIAVLAVAVIVLAILFPMQLGKANKKTADANSQIATLQGQVSSLQSNVSSLQGQLATAQNQAKTLQTSLDAATAQVKTLTGTVATQTTNINNQAAQIKLMSYPRNFNTLPELVNWLQQDDTDKMFGSFTPDHQPTDLQQAEMAMALQIKAARAGFFISVNIPFGGTLAGITNRAIVGGNMIYSIRVWDDFTQPLGTISPALPTYTIQPAP